jgi:parvulin-like peptidyl-prolyl isomerase
MKLPWFQLFLALCTVLAGAVSGQETELADRIVAVVEEDPILESDMQRVIGLGFVEKAVEESEAAFRRRVLDALIDEKLRFHEIDRFGFAKISSAEVDRALAEIKARWKEDKGGFERRLGELGMEEEQVRQLVARQLMVVTYVDERLGPRVFVGRESIQRYYDEVLAPQLQARGVAIPDLGSVREEIRAVLREQRLNEELERWTEELRAQADIEDYLDDALTALPAEVVGSEAAGEE